MTPPCGLLTMLNDTSSPRKVEQNKYPRSGEPNPKVRFGIVDAGGGSVRWADLSDYSAETFLISHVGWWPDSSSAYCDIQDRTQTWLDLVQSRRPSRARSPIACFVIRPRRGSLIPTR